MFCYKIVIILPMQNFKKMDQNAFGKRDKSFNDILTHMCEI